MTDIFDLTDRIILVTGGLGQIGSAFVRELHGRGARVAVASRTVDAARLQETFPEIADGPRLLGVSVDIVSKDSVEAGLDAIVEAWGAAPDGVINNAGLDTQPSAPPEVSGPFEDFPLDVFREVVDVNLVGTFLVTQAAGARMRAVGKPGSIINVGSIYGMVSPVQDIYAYKEEQTGVPFVKPVAYSAAKSGLYNLTRYCATYWGGRGSGSTLSSVRRRPRHAGRDLPAELHGAHPDRADGGGDRLQRCRGLPALRCLALHDRSEPRRGRGWTAW